MVLTVQLNLELKELSSSIEYPQLYNPSYPHVLIGSPMV